MHSSIKLCFSNTKWATYCSRHVGWIASFNSTPPLRYPNSQLYRLMSEYILKLLLTSSRRFLLTFLKQNFSKAIYESRWVWFSAFKRVVALLSQLKTTGFQRIVFTNHQGWQYGTVRICVLRTLHLEPYRTYVQYLSSIFEVYRTITKKGVPYSTSY